MHLYMSSVFGSLLGCYGGAPEGLDTKLGCSKTGRSVCKQVLLAPAGSTG